MNFPIPPSLSTWFQFSTPKFKPEVAVAGHVLSDDRVVLSAKWFSEAFDREKRRTERSGTPFILMTVSLANPQKLNGDRAAFLRMTAEKVSSLARNTDTVGWVQDDLSLGVIFTEVGKNQETLQYALKSIDAKITAAFSGKTSPLQLRDIVVAFTVYPEERDQTRIPPKTVGSPQRRWPQSKMKRGLDIIGSLFALTLLAPLMLLIACAVKLSSKGPVFFQQERVGQFGQHFCFLKFRSMVHGNNAQIHKDYVKKFIAGSRDCSSDGIYKLKNDPRITPVGRFLRKTSLDELPQFWNVLRGDMSLVGPRPPLPYEIEAYDLWHRNRFQLVKPGITGLWQISGRSRTKFDEMVRLDLRYVRTSSFWLDLRILLLTPKAVVQGDGAF